MRAISQRSEVADIAINLAAATTICGLAHYPKQNGIRPGAPMKIDIRAVFYSIRSSFWLIPLALGLAALGAAFAIVQIEFVYQKSGFRSPLTSGMPIESARMALSTIAGSMITIATLVFSMTLVALTLVSQQLGPRLLMRFMDDRETQIVLGLFVATFIFSLIVLLHIGDNAVDGQVPTFGVVTTTALAILSLGMMIRFIHHIATRIQADVIISELSHDLNQAAKKFAGRDPEDAELASSDELERIEKLCNSKSAHNILLRNSGYLRRIDSESVCQIATDNKLVLKVLEHPGHFILAKTPVALIAPESGSGNIDDETLEDIAVYFYSGNRRTPEASIEYEINALVEVALRALSPGINDPYTAIACLYRLADGMRVLMSRITEQRVTRDEGGRIRIMHVHEPLSRYLSISFDPIREAARNQPMVLAAMQDIMNRLELFTNDKTEVRLLKKHKEKLAVKRE